MLFALFYIQPFTTYPQWKPWLPHAQQHSTFTISIPLSTENHRSRPSVLLFPPFSCLYRPYQAERIRRHGRHLVAESRKSNLVVASAPIITARVPIHVCTVLDSARTSSFFGRVHGHHGEIYSGFLFVDELFLLCYNILVCHVSCGWVIIIVL